MQYSFGATPLDPDEIFGLRHKHITTRADLDHLEQANIEDGLIWLSKQKETNVLNEQFIKKLHLKLFGQVWRWAGTFRLTEKNIGVDPLTISTELYKLIGDCEYWMQHSVFPAVELAARFHHRLVFIHLFPNGNGRHARIMADCLLTNIFKLKPINWSGNYEAPRMQERRKQYIRALQEADRGEFKPLIDFCTIN